MSDVGYMISEWKRLRELQRRSRSCAEKLEDLAERDHRVRRAWNYFATKEKYDRQLREEFQTLAFGLVMNVPETIVKWFTEPPRKAAPSSGQGSE